MCKRQRSTRFFIALSLLAIGFGEGRLIADSPGWSQFLGPKRNGIVEATGLISEWPRDGLEVVWRAKGGVGMSGVSVAGDLAITLWNSSEGQLLVALNADNGKQVWSTRLAPNYQNTMGDGPRATPTIEGDLVYAYTGEGVLACVNLADGALVWSKSVVGDLARKPTEYGMSSSPLVVDDIVVVTAGGNGTAVVAFDRATGDKRWSAVNGTSGYSSPVLRNLAGESQIITYTGLGASGIRPADGRVLWDYPFKTPYDCNTANPIEVDGNLFISSGENHGCVMIAITKTGEDYAVREVWASVDVKSVMRNEWQTSILWDGYLYGFDNVGSAGPVTHLTCVDPKTGKTVWRKTRFGKGNLVAAAGKLWMTTMAGEFVIAEASPSGYVELGRQRLIGKTRQAPAIAGGRVYLRDDAEIVCIKID